MANDHPVMQELEAISQVWEILRHFNIEGRERIINYFSTIEYVKVGNALEGHHGE